MYMYIHALLTVTPPFFPEKREGITVWQFSHSSMKYLRNAPVRGYESCICMYSRDGFNLPPLQKILGHIPGRIKIGTL